MPFDTRFTLEPLSVHLWSVDLALTREQEAVWMTLLGPEERERALRFRFSHHRQRFIAAHGFLRHLLARYLNCKPSTIVFSYESKGKPYIAGHALMFNMSHSDDKAVYAFTLDHPIGVDIEQCLEHYPESVAKRYFSTTEWTQLNALPGAPAGEVSQALSQQAQAFYALWSRKEALIKAVGIGLGYNLSGFSVPLEPVIQIPNLSFEGRSDWHLQSFEVGSNFAAAFATQQTVNHVIQHAEVLLSDFA